VTDSALDLFAAKGYDTTNIDKTINRAGVSVRTFFRYLPSKEDVRFTDVDNHPFLDQIKAQPLDRSDAEAVRDAHLAVLPVEPGEEQQSLLETPLESTPSLLGHNLRLQAELRLLVAGALAERRGQREPANHLPPAQARGVTATVARCRVLDGDRT
jgi:AcrR family transcriptional regulator